MLLFARRSGLRTHEIAFFLMRLNLRCISGAHTVYSSCKWVFEPWDQTRVSSEERGKKIILDSVQHFHYRVNGWERVFIKCTGSAKWGRTQLLLRTRIKPKIVWMCWRKRKNQVQLILGICRMVWSGRHGKLVQVNGARPVGRRYLWLLEWIASDGASRHNWKSSRGLGANTCQGYEDV